MSKWSWHHLFKSGVGMVYLFSMIFVGIPTKNSLNLMGNFVLLLLEMNYYFCRSWFIAELIYNSWDFAIFPHMSFYYWRCELYSGDDLLRLGRINYIWGFRDILKMTYYTWGFSYIFWDELQWGRVRVLCKSGWFTRFFKGHICHFN